MDMYERVTCLACGQAFQRIDFGCSLHLLMCATPTLPASPLELREFRATAAMHLNRAGQARREALRHAVFSKPDLTLARRLLACARRWRIRAVQGTYDAVGIV